MPRGAFIVLEGLDRSGKSTQVDRLIERLRSNGKEVRLQKFPGMPSLLLINRTDRSTSIGKMIDAYLSSKTDLEDHAIHLLFSANRWECA
jgi:dTMP kinase